MVNTEEIPLEYIVKEAIPTKSPSDRNRILHTKLSLLSAEHRDSVNISSHVLLDDITGKYLLIDFHNMIAGALLAYEEDSSLEAYEIRLEIVSDIPVKFKGKIYNLSRKTIKAGSDIYQPVRKDILIADVYREAEEKGYFYSGMIDWDFFKDQARAVIKGNFLPQPKKKVFAAEEDTEFVDISSLMPDDVKETFDLLIDHGQQTNYGNKGQIDIAELRKRHAEKSKEEDDIDKK